VLDEATRSSTYDTAGLLPQVHRGPVVASPSGTTFFDTGQVPKQQLFTFDAAGPRANEKREHDPASFSA
jgi:hypothetical protein